MVFLKLLSESVKMAMNALIVNKLRTVLSLLGITIGILAIIAVFTLVDSMESNIRTNVESLGDNTVYIQKWPWMTGGDFEWWKYWQRPYPVPSELPLVRNRCLAAEAVAFMASTGISIESGSNIVERANLLAITHDYDKIRNFDLAAGRYFTELESAGGSNVCILGMAISQGLFGPINPVGRTVKIKGKKLTVIGVFAVEGESMFDNSADNQVVLPANMVKQFYRLDRGGMNPTLMVKGRPGVTTDALKAELKGVMRSIRKLKPAADDNFALNEISLLASTLESLFDVMSVVGWIIGGFSLLVGGFGIANIMFVSVKERTSLIGIQKSLGAKNWFILVEFLSEAIVLCLIGGGFGIAIVWLGTALISMVADMDLYLTVGNVVLGVGISAFIGLVAGIIPAYLASQLSPVEAMRSN